MTKRLTFELDADDPLHEKRYNRDPVVSDHVALRSGYVREFVDLANELDGDGDRIAGLLGAADPTDPTLERQYRIDSETEQQELKGLLSDLMRGIATDIDADHPLEDLAYEARSEQKEILQDDYERYRIYLRARTIRNQLEFALEHDLDLYIG